MANRSYWWVNHKQTAGQEIGGGFLWSPKTEANGARSQYCENMRRAVAGDIVASYANGSVRHIGTVIGEAITSPKPDVRSAGTTWSAEGWRLPVRWLPMPTRVRPKNHWSESV